MVRATLSARCVDRELQASRAAAMFHETPPPQHLKCSTPVDLFALQALVGLALPLHRPLAGHPATQAKSPSVDLPARALSSSPA